MRSPDFLAVNVRKIFLVLVPVILWGIFTPVVTDAADAVSGTIFSPNGSAINYTGELPAAFYSADPTAAGYCAVTGIVDGMPCQTSPFFGLFKVWGQCRAKVCVALAVTPLESSAIGAGFGVVTSLVNGAISSVFRSTPSVSPGISINTGGSGCPSGRYQTSDINRYASDPNCAIYVPPNTPPPGGCDLVSQLRGTCTATTTSSTDTTNATLTVTPSSGPAPLPVTFTVADTSASCPRSPIILSSGDGTASITAFGATNSCATRAPAIFTYTYGRAGTFQATVVNQTTQRTLQSVTVSVTNGTTTTPNDVATLTVTPNSGPAPLSVTFTVNDVSLGCPKAAITLSSGDGAAPITALAATNSCTARPQAVFTYTYGTPGTFQASLVVQPTQRTIQTATVIVTAGSTQSTGSVSTNNALLNFNMPTNVGSASAPQPPLQTIYTQSGNVGDIQLNTNGVTILSGGVRDASKNTGSSAFFGADTQTGNSAQSLAERICLVRPWQNPLISSRIPTSLFDSLCSKKGLSVGAVADATPAPATSAQPAAPKPQAATSSPASSASAVPPAVAIWATPSSVPLGSRTSIFWNSKGVSSCIVTSPDGSFSDNRLYGSASTVPLTGATVYTISCVTKDGAHVTNFVTVNIGK